MELRSEDRELILTVADNGIGFDEGTMVRSAGLGLVGMQERAARVRRIGAGAERQRAGHDCDSAGGQIRNQRRRHGSGGQTMNTGIRVLVVDDHRLVRKGLISLLGTVPEIEVVGEAENGEAALERSKALQPDVVLLDLSMPVTDGLAAIPMLKNLKPAPGILVLTSFSEDERVFAAVRAGALGYVLKDCSPDELVEAIKTVGRGQPSLSSDVAQKLVRQVHRSNTPCPGWTSR